MLVPPPQIGDITPVNGIPDFNMSFIKRSYYGFVKLPAQPPQTFRAQICDSRYTPNDVCARSNYTILTLHTGDLG
ncbi:hypothetical protein JYU34_016224 [Plutella xylostella]|uniref:Uncharacterized protein n=1 Tax=Plutella xylostella TaxID=51655 RepID=A0ABQ7Q2D7_PLUXY|nr:hypothetical protein JYU34_016224 [Plutella xylostella]